MVLLFFFPSQRGGGNAWFVAALLYSLNGKDAGILRAKAGSSTVRFAFFVPVVMLTLTLIIFGFYSCVVVRAIIIRGCYSVMHLNRRLTN
jgi:hypothetical protein